MVNGYPASDFEWLEGFPELLYIQCVSPFFETLHDKATVFSFLLLWTYFIQTLVHGVDMERHLGGGIAAIGGNHDMMLSATYGRYPNAIQDLPPSKLFFGVSLVIDRIVY